VPNESNESIEPEDATDVEKLRADGLDITKPGSPQDPHKPDLETDAEKIAADGLD